MPLPFVILTVFIAISACSIAVLLLFRDLFVPSTASGRLSLDLRRPRTVLDQRPATTLIGRFDQGFDRLVIETGLGFSPVTAVLVIILSGLLAGGAALVATGDPFPAIGAAAFAMFVALVAFQIRRARRMRTIQQQLPDVIDLMSRAVHAGENLEQAVSLVGDEVSGPLGAEFCWCSQELSLGRTVSATMHALAARIRLIDLRLLATVLAVHRRTGGNLALTLERLSAVSRDRLNYLGQIRATTGAGRISACLIAGAGPLLFLFLFFTQNEHIQAFFDSPLGNSMFAIGVALEVIGLIWITRLVKVNY